MKLPWQRRADDEKVDRLRAQERSRDAMADWPIVREHAEALRQQRELNGWTATIAAIFGAPKSREGGS